jgi:D-sedoheptulose 7-phosphate isomerase
MIELIKQELLESNMVFEKFASTPSSIINIATTASLMIKSLQSGGKLLSCGNGGSYSDAQHFASELSGKFRQPRAPIAAMALSDGGAMSCIANDFGYAEVFKRQIEAIGRPGDVLLCLSTSGNSDNVIRAAKYAKGAGITTIGICGQGGALKGYLDVMIEIPHSGDAGKIQEVTIIVIHILVALIEREKW